MFARTSVVLVSAFAAFTIVAASPPIVATSGAQCNVGEQNCCNNVMAGNSRNGSWLLGQLGIAVEDVSALIGVNCVPVLLSSAACSAQTVCCEHNNFNGLVNVGCSPINVSA